MDDAMREVTKYMLLHVLLRCVWFHSEYSRKPVVSPSLTSLQEAVSIPCSLSAAGVIESHSVENTEDIEGTTQKESGAPTTTHEQGAAAEQQLFVCTDVAVSMEPKATASKKAAGRGCAEIAGPQQDDDRGASESTALETISAEAPTSTTDCSSPAFVAHWIQQHTPPDLHAGLMKVIEEEAIDGAPEL